MQVSIKRTGGFAGLTEEIAGIDTGQLDAGQAREIEQRVREMRFFDLPDTVGETVGADLFRYEVTVNEAGRQHTVAFVEGDESEVAAPLRSLVASLS